MRRLFVGAAAVLLFAVPVIGEPIPWGTGFQIASGLVLVALAGLTAPHSSLIIIVDTIFSGAAVFMLESAAISFYRIDSIALFFVREVLAVMFLFALYAGVKTIRAMGQGKLGRPPERGEFEGGPQK
jgi:hypothetical protein